jgi:hypothetical protein
MKNGLIGLAGALGLVSTVAVASCSDYSSGDNGAGGSGIGQAGAGGSANAGSSGAGGGSSGTAGSGGSTGSGGSSGTAGGSSNDEDAGVRSCTPDAGAGPVTGLCSSLALNTLSPLEESQLCNDTGAYFKRTISRARGCRFAAHKNAASSSAPTEEQLQASCTNVENTCGADAGPGPNLFASCSGVPATCTATIAQYTACVMDEAVLFEQGATSLVTCDMLTFANLANTATVASNAADQAQGCIAIKAACSGYFPPQIDD